MYYYTLPSLFYIIFETYYFNIIVNKFMAKNRNVPMAVLSITKFGKITSKYWKDKPKLCHIEQTVYLCGNNSFIKLL